MKTVIYFTLLASAVFCFNKSQWEYKADTTIVHKYQMIKYGNSRFILTVKESLTGNDIFNDVPVHSMTYENSHIGDRFVYQKREANHWIVMSSIIAIASLVCYGVFYRLPLMINRAIDYRRKS